MAITYNLPIKDWYYDTTSEWTLDYPPLFAAFEFLLALGAHILNLNGAVELTESSIRTESIISYQKITVILSDFIYYYAIYRICNSLKPLIPKVPLADAGKKKTSTNDTSQQSSNREKILVSQDQDLLNAIFRPDLTSSIALLLLLQPGLLLVDHIHFQYNGILSGILLLSMACIIEGNYVMGSFWFAILLNMKHIYLYCAPAFGMYLLTSYCLARVMGKNRLISFIKRTIKLGLVVMLIFVINYLPFASDMSTLHQIASRLFPFKRGLTHAYWAPNIWSLYNTIDKILVATLKSPRKVNFDLESISSSKSSILSSTSGLVQEYEHQHLPSVRPMVTFVLVATFTVPLVIKFLLNINRRSSRLFIKSVTLAAFTSFMFGWHVHEKAIILVLLPLIPSSLMDTNLRRAFLRLTLTGTYSLFPLLFQPAEYLTKLTILIAYYCFAKSVLSSPTLTMSDNQCSGNTDKNGSSSTASGSFLRRMMGRLYNLFDITLVLMIIVIEFYITLIHGRWSYSWNPLAKLNKYQFLPLMLSSCFSAFGITFSYLELYHDFVRCDCCDDDDELAAAAATA